MNPHVLVFFLLFLINQTVLASPTAKLTIKVIDESGNPIQGADAGINFETPKPLGKGAGININRISGKTDSNGLFSAKGETTPQVSLGASHEDYYPSSSKFKQFTGTGGFIGFRKHEPWNPTVVLMLKEIINPIPMYAVAMSGRRKGEYPVIPVLGEFVGFDLFANDWVKPHGSGQYSDLLFKVVLDRAVSIKDYDVTLFMKFSNQGDGLIEYTPDIGKGKSLLRFPYHAPVNGYTSELVRHYERTPGVRVAGSSGYTDSETNYFFRVRTELDKDGNIIGGLYGKIHGPITLGNSRWLHEEKPYVSFNYYINPKNNDTNIEYDPERNLFKHVPNRLKVTNP